MAPIPRVTNYVRRHLDRRRVNRVTSRKRAASTLKRSFKKRRINNKRKVFGKTSGMKRKRTPVVTNTFYNKVQSVLNATRPSGTYIGSGEGRNVTKNAPTFGFQTQAIEGIHMFDPKKIKTVISNLWETSSETLEALNKEKVFITYMSEAHTWHNIGQLAVTIRLYEMKSLSDTNDSAITDYVSALSDISPAVGLGDNMSINDHGMTPYIPPLLKQSYQIMKSSTHIIQPGKSFTYYKSFSNQVMDYTKMDPESHLFLKNWGYQLLVCAESETVFGDNSITAPYTSLRLRGTLKSTFKIRCPNAIEDSDTKEVIINVPNTTTSFHSAASIPLLNIWRKEQPATKLNGSGVFTTPFT